MLKLLLDTLKTFEGVEYLVSETKVRRVESFNIRQKSEMRREVVTTDIALTLYVDFCENDESGNQVNYRGSYSVDIHPGTSAEELHEIITQGVYAAGFVKNAYYPLAPASTEPAVQNHSLDINISQALESLQVAFYECDVHDKGHISYSEFFITQRDERKINSNGVDVVYTTYNAFVETAVHWSGENTGEIEVCESYRFSLDMGIDAAKAILKERVNELFLTASKKAEAVPTPVVGNINILLSGECLGTFFSYYRSLANARLVYQQLSTFKEGENVQCGGQSDKINLMLDPYMVGSTNSRPYDDDGLALQNHNIIADGKLLKYSGDTRFASYLGIEPTGNITNMHITGGTVSGADMRKAPYLELVSFSDFQVHPITGDFGSEIRLGFYYDGTTIVPVTGGSISGNMAKVHDSLRMSKEEKQFNGYKGPAVICITGASISAVV
ncbi:MAG: metallopeptidase TldD-related protein [Defluviitaleaceae bacterium]|nr:metallopeptidase TldD-related protein [Defluviitaleaceae bacterium]